MAASRAIPIAAVAMLHAAAIAALLQAPPVRHRIYQSAPLLVQFIATPKPRPLQASALPRPALRDPATVQVSLPQFEIAQPQPVISAAARDVPAAPPMPAPAAQSPRTPTIEAPRFDLAYLRNPAPPYPPLSRRLHEQGRVLLRVRVSADGEAREVRIESSSGSERLDRAALDAVRRWRFSPARRGSEPVEGMALVPIDFALDA